MKKLVLIYLMSFKNNLATRITYRADFFFTLFITIIGDMMLPMMTFLIYSTGASFPNWNMYEVLLIQGIFTLSGGIARTLFMGIVYNTLGAVREGSYDLFLIKPVSVAFLSTTAGMDMDGLGTVLTGIILVSLSLSRLPATGVFNWITFLILLVLSVIVFLSSAFFMAGSVFKWVGNGRVMEIFDSVTFFGLYPKTIYPKIFQNIITYIFPITLIGFLPASALLGRPVEGLLPQILVCLIFLSLSILFWRFMLSKYTSAGG